MGEDSGNSDSCEIVIVVKIFVKGVMILGEKCLEVRLGDGNLGWFFI